jgi:flagellar L-ring protein precursor FlgH
MKSYNLLFALFTSVLLLGQSRADSIWDRREPRSAFLFDDSRARRVGDSLVIVIQEQTDINRSDQRKMSKQSKASALFNFKGSSKAGQLSRDATIDMSTSGEADRSFAGDSNYVVGQRFTDRVGVTVIDVLPNGNLIVEGYKRVLVADEERTTRITGIVRPDDISLANTVLSQSVANFQITYTGKGPESRFTNQNYFSRLVNILWPW